MIRGVSLLFVLVGCAWRGFRSFSKDAENDAYNNILFKYIGTHYSAVIERAATIPARTTGYLFNFPAFYAWGENLVTYKGRACKLY